MAEQDFKDSKDVRLKVMAVIFHPSSMLIVQPHPKGMQVQEVVQADDASQQLVAAQVIYAKAATCCEPALSRACSLSHTPVQVMYSEALAHLMYASGRHRGGALPVRAMRADAADRNALRGCPRRARHRRPGRHCQGP